MRNLNFEIIKKKKKKTTLERGWNRDVDANAIRSLCYPRCSRECLWDFASTPFTLPSCRAGPTPLRLIRRPGSSGIDFSRETPRLPVMRGVRRLNRKRSTTRSDTKGGHGCYIVLYLRWSFTFCTCFFLFFFFFFSFFFLFFSSTTNFCLFFHTFISTVASILISKFSVIIF
ncbi:hypothetical protein PUN28_004461 [Cardiocondyla obscurior]|uniref:Uncharacterized protein n=1 Tax=Cardiocondyla obscurior TaxID=286306 RepID=A0AAW2GAV6_9HYME